MTTEEAASPSSELTIENAQQWARNAGCWLFVMAFPGAVGAAYGLSALASGHSEADLEMWGFTALFVLESLLTLVLGVAIRRYVRWARTPGMVLAAIALIAFPYGTICGFFILSFLGSASEAGLFTKERSKQSLIEIPPNGESTGSSGT